VFYRGAVGDVVEAEAAVERLASAPADEGLVMREIWLLRMRALLAQAMGEEESYRGYSGPLPRAGDISEFRGTYAVGRGDAMTAVSAKTARSTGHHCDLSVWAEPIQDLSHGAAPCSR
jgi:hypothetical protein